MSFHAGLIPEGSGKEKARAGRAFYGLAGRR